MTTGQYPKRRETDEEQKQRAQEIALRNVESSRPPYTSPVQLTNQELARQHLVRAKQK